MHTLVTIQIKLCYLNDYVKRYTCLGLTYIDAISYKIYSTGLKIILVTA